MAGPDRPLDTYSDAASVRQAIVARYACRLHVALILGACFVVGLLVTKALLMAGVHIMWIRYSLALMAAYMVFLLGVRVWLRLAGFDRPLLPSRRRGYLPDVDVGDISGGGGGSMRVPIFRGGGGGSGGGGATANFGGSSLALDATPDSPGLALSSGGGSSSSHSGGFGIDFGDNGWVLLALIALVAAIFGGVVFLIYAAPTILADAAFAGLLSAGLVRSTRHIASGGWIGSVVGHTWFAFAIVFVLALVFAIVAQHRFPDAHSLVDVLGRL